ncbi:MAG: SGNH/GDSL hydrolase family protein [Chloroflexia bacterium]
MPALEPGQSIVFFGDSITAAQPGYVDLLWQALRQTRPNDAPRLLNAAISGNTIRDLAARLDSDVLAHRPTWVAICIGANDYLDFAEGRPEGVPLAEFVSSYAAILSRIRAAGPSPILMTIPIVANVSDEFPVPDPGPYNAAIVALAEREELPLVALHRAFYEVYERAANYKQTVSLTVDGVHPNRQGHALIARTIITQLGPLQK